MNGLWMMQCRAIDCQILTATMYCTYRAHIIWKNIPQHSTAQECRQAKFDNKPHEGILRLMIGNLIKEFSVQEDIQTVVKGTEISSRFCTVINLTHCSDYISYFLTTLVNTGLLSHLLFRRSKCIKIWDFRKKILYLGLGILLVSTDFNCVSVKKLRACARLYGCRS